MFLKEYEYVSSRDTVQQQTMRANTHAKIISYLTFDDGYGV